MLAVSSSNVEGDQFLLEDISFDDLFLGFDNEDVLPALEIDPSDIFTEISFSSGEEESGNTAAGAATADPEKTCVENEKTSSKDSSGEVEVVSARTKEEKSALSGGGGGKSRKSSSSTRVSQGKKKAKVQFDLLFLSFFTKF